MSTFAQNPAIDTGPRRPGFSGAARDDRQTLERGRTREWRPSIDIEQVRASWNLTDRLFTAIATHDGEKIAGIYADAARIDHPIAGRLTGAEVKAAWTIFLSRTPYFKFVYLIRHAGARTAEVEWSIRYIFFETGREIALEGVSNLAFEDGRIVFQRDRFSRRDWSRQALGWKGFVLSAIPGWSGFLQSETRRILGLDRAKS
jgi:SnoaL-like domain